MTTDFIYFYYDHVMKIFFIFINGIDLCLSGGHGVSLHEVVLHEALEVEVGELIVGLDLEESAQLGVGDDLTAVLLILERVGADVRVDLLAHVGAGHLGANGLAEELGELVADASGLDKARGLAVARALALLGRVLLGDLELAVHRLLERLVVALEGGEDAEKLLELGAELGETGGNRGLDRHVGLGNGGNNGGGGLDSRSGLLLGGLGLLLGLLLGGGDNNILGDGGGSRLLITLRSTDHSKLILYIRFFF